MRRRNDTGSGLMGIICILGIPLYLLMEHPLLFWLVFLPLAIIFVISVVQWFKTGGLGFQHAFRAILALVFMTVVAMIAPSCNPCEHAETQMVYSFQFENSTAASSMKQVCKECKETLHIESFRARPTDPSYMTLIKEHSDSDEIIAGEYYTVTAIVSLGDYDSLKTRIDCKLENDDMKMVFSVEFREEFEEVVSLVEKGDEITFRGQFYDTGFKDAELISN